MTPRGTGDIAWHTVTETTFDAVAGGSRLDQLAIASTYSGAIQGTSNQTLLVLYHDAERTGRGTGRWIGLEQVTGRIGDRAGSFAIEQRGSFDHTEESAGVCWEGTWQVVPGSGTGDLAGLRGGGTVTLAHQPPQLPRRTYTIDELA